MIINFLGQEDTYPQSICSLKSTKINNVKTFKYLECKVDYNYPGIGSSELKNRINSGNSAFQQYKYLLRNHHINLKTRIIFLNSYVRSRMTYGCQCWSAIQEILDKLDSSYRLMLHKIVWSVLDELTNKIMTFARYKISNKQLHQIYQTKDISTYMRDRQVNFLAHIIKKSNDCTTKQMTFEKNPNTRRGRKLNTLMTNVLEFLKLDLNQICQMALDRNF